MHRGDFVVEATFHIGLLCPDQRVDGELVLLLARESVTLGAILGKGAHQTTFFIGILKTVQKHVIHDVLMSHAIAGARSIQEVGGIRHTFHTTSDYHPSAVSSEKVMPEHHGFHA
ncbi:hypothetical protein D3C78_1283700 [compost metagenome]